MSQQFLLPCPCGHSIAVQSVDAGQQAKCPECGALAEVPQLRELRKLSPVNAQSPQRRKANPSFPVARVVFVVGLLGLALTSALSLLMFAARQQLDLGPSEEEMAQRDAEFIDGLKTEQLWGAWQKLRTEGLGIPDPSQVQMNRFHYKQMTITLERLLTASAVLGVMIAIAWFFAHEPRAG